jgi:hypothetical protein
MDLEEAQVGRADGDRAGQKEANRECPPSRLGVAESET